MKRLAFGAPVGSSPEAFRAWAIQALKKIELASNEDIETIFQAYIVTGAFPVTREIDVATATLSDVIAFLATLITDVKQGGPNRTE